MTFRAKMKLALTWLAAAAALTTAPACSSGTSSGGSSDDMGPSVEGGPIAMRRLTGEQYARSIRDILGQNISVPSRIEPDNRRSGLLGIGASFVSVTPSGFEKYEAAATSIAEQALDAAHRGANVPCSPSSESAPDDACAESFIRSIGRKLYRRSLTDSEVGSRITIAREAASALGDFYAGLELALISLLVSPDFLFRVEVAEPDPKNPGRQRLTSLSMGPRLSYLLWNTTPDTELLDAAEKGELVDDAALAAQVDRMLASPKSEAGVRSSFADLYDFRHIDEGLLRKDPALFPAYSQALAEDAKEQTLRTIVDHIVNDGKDYRDLFTTHETLMTRALGLIYQVPVATADGWEPHTFAEDGARAGILSHISLMALYSHPGRSSATLRGKFVREVLLCQEIPAPPPNVDFSIVEQTDGEHKTARDRLEAHVTNDACASCHNQMDPIGLAFENFDSIGAFRENENGATIDASGVLDGVPFDDAKGIGAVLRDHEALGPCLVKHLFEYGVGREPAGSEEPVLEFLKERFAGSGYQWTELIRAIVLSDGFRTTSGPREAEGGAE